MRFLSHVTGTRALRLLALSSALVLTACGGGGDSDPVSEPEQKRVVITADNQLQVAAHAGTSMSGVGPVAFLFAQIMIPGPIGPLVQNAAVPKVAAPLGSPAAVLAESVRKLLPAKAPSRLLAAAAPTTETETHEVECTTGSGTVTITWTESENEYAQKVVADMKACETDLRGSPALIDGKLEFSIVNRYNEAEENESATGEILATKYSVKSGEFQVGMDGDMHVEADEDGYLTSGSRFSVTGFLETVGEEEAAAQATVLTMIDFRQEIVRTDSGYQITSQNTIETDQFGETAVYKVSTTEALKYSFDSGLYIAGQYKIVGAENTTLIITADGEGTFKLQRDEKGDGSIEATVEGLTAEELYLNLLLFAA